MTAVRFQAYGDWHAVTFPYDPEVVAVIKTVPAYARTWNPQAKQWHIRALYAPELATTLRRLGHAVITGRDQPAIGGCNSWAHQLFERVGATRADAVHRALPVSYTPTPQPATNSSSRNSTTPERN